MASNVDATADPLLGGLKGFFPRGRFYNHLPTFGDGFYMGKVAILCGCLFAYVACFPPSWMTEFFAGYIDEPVAMTRSIALFWVIQTVVGGVTWIFAKKAIVDDRITALCTGLSPEEREKFKAFGLKLAWFIPGFAVSLLVVHSVVMIVGNGGVDSHCIAVVLLFWPCLPWIMIALSIYGLILFVWKLSDTCVEGHIGDLKLARNGQMVTNTGFWPEMTRTYDALDEKIEKAWTALAPTFFGTTIVIGIFEAFFVVLGLAAHVRQSHGLASVAFSYAFFIAVLYLVMLVPLASVTDRCQSMKGSVTSVRKLVGKCANDPMTPEVRSEHLAHMYFVDRSPMGVEVPMIGFVTHVFISSKCIALATLAPALISFAAGMFRSHE